MNYSLAATISIVITALLALGTSFLISDYFFAGSSWGKIVQLVAAMFFLLTFYAPIKFMLLKYMDVKEEDE